MGIKPLHDRVVIRRLGAETTTKGGLIIPDSAAEKPSQGEIVAVGDGEVLSNGETRPLSVKVGDRILMGKYAGTDIKLNGEELVVLKESEILAVIETESAEEKAA